jgi:ABC-type multidrug transport system fused ATPase/permease subunit
MPYDVVLISGPDGSGKSTIARVLKMELAKRGYPTYYVWLRYPRFLSLLPLLISRLIKISIKIEVKGICKHVLHDYRRIPILGKLYELMILVDHIIYKLFKVLIPQLIGFIVIIDRGLLDITVDVYIETKRFPKILYRVLIREFKKANSLKIVVLASHSTLIFRRKDNLCNPGFREIPAVYKVLGLNCSYKVLLNETLEDLKHIITYILSNFKPTRIYSEPKHGVLRALFYRHKLVIPLSNMIFQCANYMWKAELIFRVILQSFLIVTMAILLNLHPAIALILSHLALYPLYSNPLGIQKWLQKKRKTVNFKSLNMLLQKLNRIERNKNRCINIRIVGSLSHNPCKLLLEGADIDIRLVPASSIKCIITSLIVAPYIRFWSLLRGIPLDLYVKPINSSELKNSKSLTEFTNSLIICKEVLKS